MSAWYILSSLEFYPVNPADNEFVLGAPQLQRARLQLNNGKSLLIESLNYSPQNIYSEKILLNAQQIEKPFITFEEIMNGGKLSFEMKNN